MLVNNTAFLCGYFSAKKTLHPSLFGEWIHEEHSQASCEELSQYYLPEFATFMTRDMAHYTYPIDKPCHLHFSETESAAFRITRLHLWTAPFGLVLFAVETDFEHIDFNLMTKALGSLRNCVYYNDMHTEFIDTALLPTVKIYNAVTGNSLAAQGNLTDLIESGNKFKIFQTISLTEPIEDDDPNLVLFDAGTLSKHIPHSTGMNSADYYQSIMDKHRVSVFNGWTGLALLDSFTLLSTDTPEWVINNWKSDYFGMIYIYQLFRKVFLYNVNMRYRKRTEDVEVLEGQLEQFEKDYSFNTVSYNFLPNIIKDAMEESLGTENDSTQIYKMIGSEMEKRRNRAEERTNKFLTFLTCITIFSAIFDFTSLLDSCFDYSTVFSSSNLGYRTIGLIMLTLVVAVYALIIMKQHKRK